MTNEDFIALVKRAEQSVENNPKGYRMRLLCFCLLGYIVIFGALLTLIFLVTGSIVAAFYASALFILLLKSKLIFLFMVMAWVLLKSLWVRFDKPDGFFLNRNDYPVLFDEIDKIRKELGSLPIHQVILTSELNAAVVQTPRLGIFGWQYNTLFIGLELLMILSEEQARAVIAHELGHLSHNHSRFSGWIYRVRVTWDRIMHAFSRQDGLGVGFMKKFFQWYAPRFAAYSFALARNNEYEADAMSAALTSRDAAAQALINVHVAAPYVNNYYWQNFFRKADDHPVPQEMPWAGLAHFLSTSMQAQQDIDAFLKKELDVKSTYDDTHPSLNDRLQALGVEAILPAVSRVNAAQLWLGGRLKEVIDQFDRKWINASGERWKQRFDYVTEAKIRLIEYQQSNVADMSNEDLWRFANLTFDFNNAEAALPLYQRLQTRVPEHAGAAYVMGIIFFERNDEVCLTLFEKATVDSQYTVHACRYASMFLERNGRDEETRRWHEYAHQQMALDEEAEAERSQVSVNDDLTTPQMRDEFLEALVDQLKVNKLVTSAWLAQKVVKLYPERPVYIVAFKAPFFNFKWSRGALIKQVADTITVPTTIFVVVCGGDSKKLAKLVMRKGQRLL